MQRKTWRHYLWKVHLSVSGNQPNSLKSCSQLTSLILRLRIIRAPRFCNLNRLSKYVLSELDQTIILQYWYKGWTIELCKYLQTSILINFLILLKSPSLHETFKAIVSINYVHASSNSNQKWHLSIYKILLYRKKWIWQL